jgi:hypothetical protein
MKVVLIEKQPPLEIKLPLQDEKGQQIVVHNGRPLIFQNIRLPELAP